MCDMRWLCERIVNVLDDTAVRWARAAGGRAFSFWLANDAAGQDLHTMDNELLIQAGSLLRTLHCILEHRLQSAQ